MNAPIIHRDTNSNTLNNNDVIQGILVPALTSLTTTSSDDVMAQVNNVELSDMFTNSLEQSTSFTEYCMLIHTSYIL